MTSLNKAVSRFEMWHQKEHDKVLEMPLTLPRSLRRIGAADNIVYHSDKWEEKNKFYPYEHAFTSKPVVYVGVFSGEPRRASTDKDTKSFFKLKSLNDTVAWPLLAYVEELDLFPDGQRKKTRYEFDKMPMMLCADEKTLVILHKQFFVVRGGDMRVTERGIVK